MTNSKPLALNPKLVTSLVLSIGLISGCASTPQPPVNPGVVSVKYTQNLYGQEASLKHIPDEVRIVTQESTKKGIATQVLSGIFLGSFGSAGTTKNQFRGDAIELEGARDNLKVTAPTVFVERLENSINSWIQDSPDYMDQAWKNPIMISDGSARLIYDKLLEDTDKHYRLVNNTWVYKRKESAGLLSVFPTIDVNCSTKSEPILLKEWQVDNYKLVRTELDKAMNNCEQAVLAKLPELLKD